VERTLGDKRSLCTFLEGMQESSRQEGTPRKLRTPLKPGKKFRLGEALVEVMIKSVAFVSIAAIVLIFVFVFKEASPIVFGTHKTKVAAVGTAERTEQEKPTAEIEQEVYDPLADDGAEKKVSQSKESLKQEVYDPLAEEGDTQQTSESAATIDTAAVPLTAAEEDSTSQAEHALDVERYDATSLSAMATGTVWQPVSDVPKFGFVALFIGTLKVTLIALLFAAPLAILAAIYTNTFASRKTKEVIKPIIELLAGFPSVVIGFFALIVLATVFQDLFGYTFRLNSFVGGIAMALAVIPIIYTISEDALTAVPETLRDASTALGATKWQTAFKVILPAAVPGVFAAIILGFGRAFGETMIALMATGNAPLISANPFEPVRTFSATIGAEMAEVVFGDEHYGVLFLIGAMLFVFTFTMNSIVEFYVRKRLIRRIQGK
jgi:phosphate transport system permease protein